MHLPACPHMPAGKPTAPLASSCTTQSTALLAHLRCLPVHQLCHPSLPLTRPQCRLLQIRRSSEGMTEEAQEPLTYADQYASDVEQVRVSRSCPQPP